MKPRINIYWDIESFIDGRGGLYFFDMPIHLEFEDEDEDRSIDVKGIVNLAVTQHTYNDCDEVVYYGELKLVDTNDEFWDMDDYLSQSEMNMIAEKLGIY